MLIDRRSFLRAVALGGLPLALLLKPAVAAAQCVIPCVHRVHPYDVVPCMHVCFSPYGPVPCHPLGDAVPCIHPVHLFGDIIPC
jgi:hypothetical protein